MRGGCRGRRWHWRSGSGRRRDHRHRWASRRQLTSYFDHRWNDASLRPFGEHRSNNVTPLRQWLGARGFGERIDRRGGKGDTLVRSDSDPLRTSPPGARSFRARAVIIIAGAEPFKSDETVRTPILQFENVICLSPFRDRGELDSRAANRSRLHPHRDRARRHRHRWRRGLHWRGFVFLMNVRRN